MAPHSNKIERIDEILSKAGAPNVVGRTALIKRHETASKSYFRFLESMAQNALLVTSVINIFSKETEGLEKLNTFFVEERAELPVLNSSSGDSIRLTVEDQGTVSGLIDSYVELKEDAARALYGMYITSTVSCFEIFIQDLLYAIFTKHPSTLRSSKTITYFDLLSYPDMDGLVSHLAQVEASKSTEGSVNQYLSKIAKRLGIHEIAELIKKGAIKDSIGRLIGVRNVIVHNGGVVDSAYIKRFPNGIFQEEGYIKLELEDIAEWSSAVRLLVGLLEIYVVEKFPLIAIAEWSEKEELHLQEILSLEEFSRMECDS